MGAEELAPAVAGVGPGQGRPASGLDLRLGGGGSPAASVPQEEERLRERGLVVHNTVHVPPGDHSGVEP